MFDSIGADCATGADKDKEVEEFYYHIDLPGFQNEDECRGKKLEFKVKFLGASGGCGGGNHFSFSCYFITAFAATIVEVERQTC